MQTTAKKLLQSKGETEGPGTKVPEVSDLLRLAGGRQVSLQANTVIETGGDDGFHLGVIRKGTVGLQHRLNDGRRSISSLFLDGALLDFRLPESVPGSFVCFSPVKLTLISTHEFEQACRKNPKTLELLATSHRNAWREVIRHSVDLSRKSAIEKLASFIFECQQRCAGKNGKSIHLILKRIDIADYLGLRPETLCRAFARLRQGNLIDFDGNDHIKIRNEAALRRISAGSAL